MRPRLGDPPVGSLVAYAGAIGSPAQASPPNADPEPWGWMLCDGRSLVTALYPELFNAIGYLYGGSGGQFCIPDYRGTFLRGTDAGANIDPEASARTSPAGGSTTDSGVGSRQGFAVQVHEHTYLYADTAAPPAPSGSAAGAPLGQPKLTQGGPTSSLSPPGQVQVSAHETRPMNTAVHWLIKFTAGLWPQPW